MRKPALALLLIALYAPGALAQSRMSGSMNAHPAAPPPAPAASNRFSIGISGGPASNGRFFGDGFRHRRFPRNPFFFGAPYFYSDYYGPYENDYAPPPPAPAAEPAPVVKNEPLPDPVLLELRGDQWVRVSDFRMLPASSSASGGAQSVGRWNANAKDANPTAIAKEMAPAILVYRDGHTEDVTSYSIIGDAIYTKANYWTDGAWTRKIEIANLDIPATLKQNHERGVKFELPAGPNEVVIRP
jgi:hypothetical protein